LIFLFQGKHAVTKKTFAGIITFLEDDALHPDLVNFFTTLNPKMATTTESFDEFEMIDETLVNAEEEADNVSTLNTFSGNELTTPRATVLTLQPETTTTYTSAVTSTNPALTEVTNNVHSTISFSVATASTASSKTALPNDGLIYFPLD
jgi:hypothetical protein